MPGSGQGRRAKNIGVQPTKEQFGDDLRGRASLSCAYAIERRPHCGAPGDGSMIAAEATMPVEAVTAGDRGFGWAAFAWAPLLYGLFFTALRPLNEGPYLVAVVLAVPACFAVGRLVLLPGQFWLILLSVAYLILSLFDVLPPAWTIYHDNIAAIRHWSWIIVMPILVTAFYAFFMRYRNWIIANALKLFCIAYAMRTLSQEFSQSFDFYDGIFLGRFSLYSPDNETLPLIMLLVIAAYRGNHLRSYQIAILALIIPASTSMGTFLAALISFGLRFIRAHRLALYGLLLVLLIFLFLAPFFYRELDNVDVNSGVRAIFWRDTQLAVWQTWGVGVGFGTEYITNWFGDIGRTFDYALTAEDASDRLFISNHSIYYDVALRMGLVGVALFITMIAGTVKAVESRMAAPMCAYLIVSIGVVPALTTVDTQIGICLLIGWILADRDVGRDSDEPETFPNSAPSLL